MRRGIVNRRVSDGEVAPRSRARRHVARKGERRWGMGNAAGRPLRAETARERHPDIAIGKGTREGGVRNTVTLAPTCTLTLSRRSRCVLRCARA
jgi:hypothetical protein